MSGEDPNPMSLSDQDKAELRALLQASTPEIEALLTEVLNRQPLRTEDVEAWATRLSQDVRDADD